MKLKSLFVRGFAKNIAKRIDKLASNAVAEQEKTFGSLIQKASDTDFGKDHGFPSIRTYEDFRDQVPLRSYEELRPYIDRVVAGEKSILWPGQPAYIAKTSGTTSGIKYIPISSEAISHHVTSARNALFYYSSKYNDYSYLDGKMIFLSGSPELYMTNGIPTGRLSGIVNHQVPMWLRRSQLPSYETNAIEDWEYKLDRIVEETIDQNMTLISGIPPWVVMYYERLLEVSGKGSISELFPDLNMFVHGGVSFRPYETTLNQLVGKTLNSIETYPTSEGFIAFQDDQDDHGLLLILDNGIFYEFIPEEEIHQEKPTRLTLQDVVIGKNYGLILNTNSGLWGYQLGDLIKFTSLSPYKISVAGRTKHFISAFGEHVIAQEVENAMTHASKLHEVPISEFTVAPVVNAEHHEKPHHEWLIEVQPTAELPLTEMAKTIDQKLIEQNIYYKDLREGQILGRARITVLPPGSFAQYMKQEGKLGGQNKVPRLANDRKIADKLLQLL